MTLPVAGPGASLSKSTYLLYIKAEAFFYFYGAVPGLEFSPEFTKSLLPA